MEALKPFIVANTKQDPPPMKHLHHSDDFNFDIELAVSIKRESFFDFLRTLFIYFSFRFLSFFRKGYNSEFIFPERL